MVVGRVWHCVLAICRTDDDDDNNEYGRNREGSKETGDSTAATAVKIKGCTGPALQECVVLQ